MKLYKQTVKKALDFIRFLLVFMMLIVAGSVLTI